MKKVLLLLLIPFFCGCANKSGTEKTQNKRNNIISVRGETKEIPIDDVLIGSIARLFLMDNYLIIVDHTSSDKLIHIFTKNDFSYLTSIADVGQGPGEITVMGHIGINEACRKFYVSDHGKQKIFSYDIDSVLINPYYMPEVKTEMNMIQFPDKYEYMSDTLSVAILIEPTSVSTFNQSLAKWNINSGIFEPMKYQHPDIEKKRINFAASIKHNLYVECYHYYDLMTICSLEGDLKYNIYGPAWNKKVTNRILYYNGVRFCGDKIVASYSGGANFTDEKYPTKFEVFDIDGNYLCTLETGYKIVDFCYDEDYDRIIMNLNDEIQFAYLDLKDVKL